jgi:hypothetical protein
MLVNLARGTKKLSSFLRRGILVAARLSTFLDYMFEKEIGR